MPRKRGEKDGLMADIQNRDLPHTKQVRCLYRVS
jgi:hypothetical protein